MATMNQITVFDGASTPVTHTLAAISVTRDASKVVADWRELNANVPSYAQISASIVNQRLASGVYKIDVKVNVPVMESIAGQNASGYTAAPKVAYTNTLVCTGYFHERSTITDRRLARMILVNILNNVSTSVAAATTGFGPDALDSLVAPT
jgi:hypothetical protein